MEAITRRADVLCVAVGQPRLITADMIKEGAVVIDVGFNVTSEGVGGTLTTMASFQRQA